METSTQECSLKTQRKIIERNRRNKMKILYSDLNSLLPNHNSSKVIKSLPDQIGNAGNYIKKLQKDVEKLKEKKECLKNTMNMRENDDKLINPEFISPQIEINNVGSDLQVIFISRFDHQFIFYEIIRVLHEEGAEIMNANYSIADDTAFHTIHSKVGETHELDLGVARLTRRLKKLVYEYVNDGT